MTWTYTNTPGMTTSASRRDGVRFLVGDTETTDQQVTDEEINFALTEAGDDIYYAGSLIARAIAAKYARLVDTAVDEAELRVSYSQRQKAYAEMATRLEVQSVKSAGGGGLGLPSAGGVSVTEMNDADLDTDRVKPVFEVSSPTEQHDDISSS
jgi:hypothetical protein